MATIERLLEGLNCGLPVYNSTASTIQYGHGTTFLASLSSLHFSGRADSFASFSARSTFLSCVSIYWLVTVPLRSQSIVDISLYQVPTHSLVFLSLDLSMSLNL